MLLLVKSKDSFLLSAGKEHTVKFVTIWASGKKLFTLKRNFENDPRLVKTAEQVIIHVIKTAAGPLALVDTRCKLLCKSHQMM